MPPDPRRPRRCPYPPYPFPDPDRRPDYSRYDPTDPNAPLPEEPGYRLTPDTLGGVPWRLGGVPYATGDYISGFPAQGDQHGYVSPGGGVIEGDWALGLIFGRDF